MIHLNVLLTVNDAADVEAVADAVRRAGELSQREPGCARWEAYQADADPKRILLVEQWESEAALDGHRRGEAYTQIYSKQQEQSRLSKGKTLESAASPPFHPVA